MGSDSESQDSDEGKCFKFNVSQNSNNKTNSSDEGGFSYGPMLPPKSNKQTEKEAPQSSNRIIGPSLPPSTFVRPQEEEEVIADAFGPSLPPHLLQKKKEAEVPSSVKPKSEDDNEVDMIGPLPADHPTAKCSFSQQKLEERAWRIKNDFENKGNSDEKKREEWMMELPPTHSSNLGLGPRKFKLRPGPENTDRSCWTDTPADRARKQKEMMEKRTIENPEKQKEKEREKQGDEEKKKKHNSKEKSRKREKKSLLEIHQEKLKKKRKKKEKEARESGKSTRRPFDRDIDLKINDLNQAQKKSILLKSRELDDRFCSGKK